MRKSLFVISLFLLIGSQLYAQVFIVESGNKSTAYADLESAIAAANAGDNVYIPGGTHEIKKAWKGYSGNEKLANTLAIEKKLNLIGGGYTLGANTPKIVGTVVLTDKASGSTLTGIYFNDNMQWDNVSNVSMNRCYVNGSMYLSGVGSNNLVTECDLYQLTGAISYTGSPNSSSPLQLVLSKNKIKHISSLSNLTLTNNFISTGLSQALRSLSYSTFENNIIDAGAENRTCIYSVSFCNFKHNLVIGYFDAGNSATCTFSNNMERVEPASVFIDADKGDYHLNPGSIGKKAGTDRTDVGLYGTSFPFKENCLPAIPHFSRLNVASETSAEQTLKIDFKIEAQDR